MAHVFIVANEIIRRGNFNFNNMKVQKLTYIANGFALAILNEPLFFNECRAWQYGPVIPELYEKLKCYGKGIVRDVVSHTYQEKLSENQIAIIAEVVKSYAKVSSLQLSTLTHKKGTPWQKVWSSGAEFAVIPNTEIKEYYKRQLEKIPERKRVKTTTSNRIVKTITTPINRSPKIVASFPIKVWKVGK